MPRQHSWIKALFSRSRGAFITARRPGLRFEFLEDRIAPAAGDLDTAFGTGGITTTAFESSYDTPRTMLVQPDGKVILIGTTQVGFGPSDLALARYNADGTIDDTFGDNYLVSESGNGHVFRYSTSPPGGYPRLRPVQGNTAAALSGGKILVASDFVTGNQSVEVLRLNADGTNDHSFGQYGLKIVQIPADVFNAFGEFRVQTMVAQPDGKLVLAGHFASSSGGLVTLRLNPDGSLDTGYDGDGIALMPVGQYVTAERIALDGLGRIVIAGSTYTDHDYGLVARFTPTGGVDTSFGGFGWTAWDYGGTQGHYSALSIRSDNSILVSGSAYIGSTSFFALSKYTASGQLDAGFGTHPTLPGTTTFSLAPFYQRPGGVSSGTLDTIHELPGGDVLWSSGNLFARTTSLGAPVTSYGDMSNGLMARDYDIWTVGAVVQPDASLRLFGQASFSPTAESALPKFATARVTSGGLIDHSYGVVPDRPFTQMRFESVASAITPGGQVVVAGTIPNANLGDFGFVRYTPTGAFDTALSNNPWQSYRYPLTHDLPGGWDLVTGVATQADGKIIMVGWSSAGLGIVRYRTSGDGFNLPVDNTFNPPTLNNWIPTAVQIQADGKILVTATEGGGEAAVLRFLTTGALDNGFGTGGIKRLGFQGQGSSTNRDGIVVQSDGKIVVAFGRPSGFPVGNVITLARLNLNGSVDTTFGTSGQVTVNYGQFVKGFAVDPLDRLVLGTGDRIYRFSSEGTPDFGIGTNGYTTMPGNETIATLAMDADWKVVVSVEVSGSSPQRLWRIKENGSIDTHFGTNGLVQLPGTGSATGITFRNGRIYVSGDRNGMAQVASLKQYNDVTQLSILPQYGRNYTGVRQSISVDAFDAFGERVRNYTGQIHFTSSDPLAVLPADYTFTQADGGYRYFQNEVIFHTGGFQTITATDTATGTILGTLQYVLADPTLDLTGTATTNAGSSFDLSVVVRDTQGQPMWDYVGPIHFSSTDSMAVLPGPFTFSQSDMGQHTFTGVVLGTFGLQSVTVSGSPSDTIAIDVKNTVLNTNDSGPGSLRNAITLSNASVGVADTITFAIGSGVQSIALRSALPTITDAVVIDGTTQPGYSGTPVIELNGAGAGSGVNGLTITSAGSTIKGLVINRFGGSGVLISGTSATGNVIAGNYIGSDATGTQDLGNAADGVRIQSGASNNTIGGSSDAARNVISGNNSDGIEINGATTSGNLVRGNYIGTNAAGAGVLGNSVNGVALISTGANVIGGTAAGAGNVISGNGQDGVTVSGSGSLVGGVGRYRADGNANDSIGGNSGTVQGGMTYVPGATGQAFNFTGSNYVRIPNSASLNVTQMTVGGWIKPTFAGRPAAANDFDTIFTKGSGTGYGYILSVLMDPNGVFTQMPSGGVPLGTPAFYINIGGSGYGLYSPVALPDDGQFHHVAASFDGSMLRLFVDGAQVANRAVSGTVVNAVVDAFIGGQPLAPAPYNKLSRAAIDDVILANRALSVEEISLLMNARGGGNVGNLIQGNIIGSDRDGNADLGNARNGVRIESGASGNLIGGNTLAARNVIGGNNSDGVVITGSGTNNNTVAGNYVGTNKAGDAPLANGHGIVVNSGAANTVIGGGAAGTRNVLSGNLYSGIANDGAISTVIAGNYIGVNAAGTDPLSNNVGIYCGYGSTDTRIGTNGDGINDAGERNVISGNPTGAMYIQHAGTNRTVVAGNYIGTNEAGDKSIANSGSVVVQVGATNTRIGTDGSNDPFNASERNVISSAKYDGVVVTHVGTTGTVIAGNYIGTDAGGTGALGNGGNGVGVYFGASDTRIGTNADGFADEEERNVISGNSGDGIRIQSVAWDGTVPATPTTRVTIAGNYIGTDKYGTSAVPNTAPGVFAAGVHIVGGARGNLVGTNGDGIRDDVERNVISGNRSVGVRIADGGESNVVAGNYIGTTKTGMAPLGNGQWGVILQNNAKLNLIGTDGKGNGAANERNIIAASGIDGVHIVDGANNNVVAGNYIGMGVLGDVAGSVGMGNGGQGVLIGRGAYSNRIGTDGNGVGDTAERNVIGGSRQYGVVIYAAGSNNNVVAGNYIGTDADGMARIQNGLAGVSIQSGAKNNRIGTDGNGVGDEAERNIISGNGTVGMWIVSNGTDGNIVAGNFIGPDKTGKVAIGNGPGYEGVAIGSGAKNNRIGSAGGPNAAVERNLISGNAGAGVSIGVWHTGAGTSGNVVAGNYIGTDIDGTAPLGNGGAGIVITNGATGNHIGAAPADLVVADFNTRDIKLISGLTGAVTVIVPAGTGGLTRPNRVLVGPDGNIYVNSEDGSGNGDDILKFSPTGQFLGAFIANTGVYEAHFAFGPDGNFYLPDPYGNVVRKYDGTTGAYLGVFANVAPGSRAMTFGPNGNLYLAEKFFNDGGDINVYDGTTGAFLRRFNDPTVRIGRAYDPVWGPDGDLYVPASVDDRVLRLDGRTGALVRVIDTSGHERYPYAVGFAQNGELYVSSYGTGNSGGGSIARYDPDTGEFLGYVDAPNSGIISIPFGFDFAGSGAGNTIAFNGGAGIVVTGEGTTGNKIQQNSIYSNGGLGIDLGGDGVTANDAADADAGPNYQINFPVLTTATNGAATRVTGSIDAAGTGPFTIEFFASPAPDASGHGGGRRSLGTATLAAAGAFDITVGATVTGEWVTATVTDADGNTSEFSLTVLTNNPPVVSVGGPYAVAEGGTLALDASATTDLDGDELLYSWDVNGDGVFGDAIGVSPTLTWTDLVALGLADGPAGVAVRVRVDDQRGGVVTANGTTLTVANTAPTADLVMPTHAVRFQERAFTLLATDHSPVDQAAGFTFDIDWDGNGTIDETVTGPSGTVVSHTFTTARTYTIVVTARDKDGGSGTPVSKMLTVAVAQMQGDDLVVGGATASDRFVLSPGGSAGQLVAVLNGRTLGTFTVPGGVRLFGGGGIDLVTVNGTAGADAFDVRPGTTVYNGRVIEGNGVERWVLNGRGGNDAFSLSGGSAAINGNAGQDTLSANTAGDHLWLIDDTGAGSLDANSFTGVEHLKGGEGDDAFVFQDGASVAGVVDGGGGVDLIDYSASDTRVTVNLSNGTASNTGGVAGVEQFFGGTGDRDRFTAADGENTWVITEDDGGTINDSLSYYGFEAIVGGAGADRFILESGGSISLGLSGGAGTDTLDYSRRGTAVAVNLAAGNATATGGVTTRTVENVIGGAGADALVGDGVANMLIGGAGNDSVSGGGGNDILLGGAGDDILNGGDGRDLLFGGSGVDSLTGGSGGNNTTSEDLLVGGVLAYYLEPTNTLDLTAVVALAAEWNRTDLPYADRVAHLSGTPGGLNGASVLNATSISDDAAADTLSGGTATDWFLATISGPAPDVLTDRTAGEILTAVP